MINAIVPAAVTVVDARVAIKEQDDSREAATILHGMPIEVCSIMAGRRLGLL